MKEPIWFYVESVWAQISDIHPVINSFDLSTCGTWSSQICFRTTFSCDSGIYSIPLVHGCIPFIQYLYIVTNCTSCSVVSTVSAWPSLSQLSFGMQSDGSKSLCPLHAPVLLYHLQWMVLLIASYLLLLLCLPCKTRPIYSVK